ncbi:MAG: hypothetical protein ACI9OJ_004458 [Myxococcota bacterium]
MRPAPKSTPPLHADSPDLRLGVAGASVTLLAGLGYLALCSPGLYWRDAGELSASAFGLGVAHPTGFSLYILLAKAATFLPFGHIAFRINLLSALCAALTVALTFRVVIRLVGTESGSVAVTRAAAACAALVVSGGSTFWLHATTAEVYIPNLLALVWFLELAIRADGGSHRALRAAAILTGLAAGLHAATFAVCGAVIWLWLLARIAMRPEPRRQIGWSAALSSMGAIVIAYLPIRAMSGPWRNWGNPSSASALWDHLSGARIRDAYGSEMASGQRFDVNLEIALGQLGEQVSWIGFFAVGGLCWLALTRGRTHWALVLLGVWFADVLYTVVLNPMGMVDLQTGVVATLITAIAGGVGLAALGHHVLERAFRPTMSAALLSVIAIALASPALLGGGAIRDLRSLYHAQDLGDYTLDYAWPRSLLLVSSDDMASTLTYAQGVENQRPDVLTLVKQHISDVEGLENLGKYHDVPAGLMTSARSGAGPRALLTGLLKETRSSRPTRWEVGDAAVDGLVDDRLKPAFPLARLYGPYPPNMPIVLASVRTRWRAFSRRWPETALAALSRMYSLAGTQMARTGRAESASDTIGVAYSTFQRDAVVLNNFALSADSLGDRDQAFAVLQQAVALRPDYARGWFNLGVIAFHKGEGPVAHSAFGQAAKLGLTAAKSALAAYYSAVLHANDGHYGRALALLDSARASLPPRERAEAARMARQVVAIMRRATQEP